MRGWLTSHLRSRQVSRVIYGAIIGLALVVALEVHPPEAGAVAATLVGTAIAVGLAEAYSEIVALETRGRRHARRSELRDLGAHVAAVAAGIAFPSVYFGLAATGVLEEAAAFELAKWSGLGVIGVYGFVGARASGSGLFGSLLQAAAVALIGGFLIALKAVVH
jgi:hypothetical protein